MVSDALFSSDYPALELGLVAMGVGICGWALFPSVATAGLVVGGLSIVVAHFTSKSKYDIVFHNLKLCIKDKYPIYVDKREHEHSTVYEYTMPAGLSLDDVVKHRSALETFAQCQLDITVHSNRLFLREIAEQTLYNYKPVQVNGNVPVLIGYDNAGRLITADLATGEPHMYIAGTTGSGKSTALRAIITNLIVKSGVELYLVDLKNGVELGIFKRCAAEFAKTESEAEQLLQSLVAEQEHRYELFDTVGCNSIAEYNKHHALPYMALAIDEYAVLMANKRCKELLERLSALARACGIHIILATQRPDSKVLSGRIKANVTNVLGLRAIDATNSRIIIDHTGLEDLRGAGQGIFSRGGKETMVQCPYISPEDAKALIKPFEHKEPQKVKQQPAQEPMANFDCMEGFNVYRP